MLIAAFMVQAALACSGQAAEPEGLARSLVVSGQGYFPVALRLADGRIAVVLRGGAPHLGIQGRLDIVFSSDEGKSWSKPAVVVDTPVDDRNPAFGQAQDGTLVVAYWRTARYDDQGRYNEALAKPVDTWVTRSRNGGRTWSAPVPIDVTDIDWGSPYGRILTMPDGAMLMNIYGGAVRRPGQKPPNEDNSYLYRSTDHGQTWTRYSHPGARRFNETALVRLRSGEIMAAMRSAGVADLWLTRSMDNGKTWSEPQKLTPPAVHPADLTVLPDGRVLLTTGYRVGPHGVRALVSGRDGRWDWDQHMILVNDATNSDCGYPSNVLLNDGRVLTVYYAVGTKDKPKWGVHCGAVAYKPPAGR